LAAKTVLRRASTLALVLLGSMPIFAESGCADQGEGERCTFFKGGDAGENGSNECSAGLVCTVTSYYSADNTTAGVGTLGVCCPPSGTASTAAACQPTVGGSTTGGAPTGDGGFDGSLDTGAPDAKADAAPDASDAAQADAHPTTDATIGDATISDAKPGN
jgi:hypothetical protein